MTHTALIDWVLTFHGSVLVISIMFFFKYADRTSMFEKSFSISDEKMKERIYGELTATLKPLFSQSQDKVIKVLGDLRPDGEAWEEEAVDPQGTEDYKNSLHRLINKYPKSMADLRSLKTIDDWCRFWAGYLSWSMFSVLIMQGVALGYCAIVDKIFDLYTKSPPVYILVAFSIVSIINALIPLPFLLYYHGRIDKYGREYN